jgi:carbonic anhydrase/acetyltransferase-like protein (isoleucine patch superfamily)
MIRSNVVGDKPNIDSTSFVDPSAIIIGRVDIGPNCYVGPAVVLRADRFSTDDTVSRIVLGANCCIQDGAVLHVHAEDSLHIGDNTIINHGAVVHGSSIIGPNSFIGCKSVITHANIGNDVFIRSNAIIEEVVIAPERFVDVNVVINTPDAAAALRGITEDEKAFMRRAVDENKEYPVRYKYSLEK